jgi:hypothetical protein
MAISRFKTSTLVQGLPKYTEVWDQTTVKSLQNWSSANVGASDIRGFIAKPNESVGVAYTYIGTGSGNAFYSTNGTTWNNTSGYVNGCLGMTWDGTQFYGLSYAGGLKLTSTDGINWSNASVSINTNYSSVAYGNGYYVGVDRNGNSFYSTNGTSYTQVNLYNVGSDCRVTYGGGVHLVIKNSAGGSTTYYTSTNGGVSWTSRTAPAGPYYVSYINGTWFMTVASGTTYYTSTDAVNWTSRATLPAARTWAGVSYSNGVYVSVAAEANLSAYSLDGINWTSKAFSPSGSFDGGSANPSQGAVNNYVVYPNDDTYINYAKAGF